MSNSDPRGRGLTPEQRIQYQRTLDRLDRYAGLLDSRFRIPFTRIRFGLEPLIGLLPGIGDLAGFGLSLYLVGEAVKLRAGSRLIGKMLGNVAVDFVVGLVPVLGDAFDLVWRANDRNARLLREHIEQTLRPPQPHTPWLTRALWVVFGVMVLALIAVLVAAV
ncbi:MAG: DUF4112 domain-containing protein [Marinobacter sp.]|uniref:DUF4112 domain-containing protein n=1 Tax=Marinobacter sp. TaxID=50741 RepID=UPI00299EC919|nr:DUF4112 domain-containing protein [Marinobacter sp.]MDX1634229.1 DUF4112 domain-containing protein [Marinobacter sp.]